MLVLWKHSEIPAGEDHVGNMRDFGDNSFKSVANGATDDCLHNSHGPVCLPLGNRSNRADEQDLTGNSG